MVLSTTVACLAMFVASRTALRPRRCPPLSSPRRLRSWDRLAAQHGDALAGVDPHHHPAEEYSFARMAASITQFAAGLQSLGLRCGGGVSGLQGVGVRADGWTHHARCECSFAG